MGSDKAFLKLEETTLLVRAVDFCMKFCDETFISSSNPKHQFEGIKRIGDEIKDCGPIGGIYSSLKQSSNDWNFVLSVDAPFAEQDFVDFMIKKTKSFDAVVPLHNGKKEPLMALYHKKILPQIEVKLKEGIYKLHFLLHGINTNFVESDEWLIKYPKLFQNLNYPEELS